MFQSNIFTDIAMSFRSGGMAGSWKTQAAVTLRCVALKVSASCSISLSETLEETGKFPTTSPRAASDENHAAFICESCHHRNCRAGGK